MVRQKKRRREGTDTEPGSIKALRQEVEELRNEVERLREENEELREERAKPREGNEGNEEMKLAKLEAGCQTPQEEKKEVKLPTEVWAIIAKKLDKNDVCSFALVSKQLREAQVLAGRKLVTRAVRKYEDGGFGVHYFTEDWCAYWSRKFSVHQTDPKVVKQVLYVAARHGYLQVFEKYWSQGPQEKLSELWDEETCIWAACGGHLEVMKWLRAKGCPWDEQTSNAAAGGGHLELAKWLRAKGCPWDQSVSREAACGGHLEVLQWVRGQDPPWPWNEHVCFDAAQKGHLDILRWARSQGCPWDEDVPCAAAEGGRLEVLQWMRAQDPPCPWDSRVCAWAACNGHLEVLRWARSQGCPWDTQAPCAAAEEGHLKVLKWLIKEGCPYDKRECRRYAVKGGECAREVLEWLDE
ncbi:putative ankyrin repeat protein [Chloropicon roscoffensis]|uniref:Ankyrin repeat protein n=1 Tax=Chloropicon roscoffensis TaxID=1461544 RepID=A0AAX4NWJ5_9CHLO